MTMVGVLSVNRMQASLRLQYLAPRVEVFRKNLSVRRYDGLQRVALHHSENGHHACRDDDVDRFPREAKVAIELLISGA